VEDHWGKVDARRKKTSWRGNSSKFKGIGVRAREDVMFLETFRKNSHLHPRGGGGERKGVQGSLRRSEGKTNEPPIGQATRGNAWFYGHVCLPPKRERWDH